MARSARGNSGREDMPYFCSMVSSGDGGDSVLL